MGLFDKLDLGRAYSKWVRQARAARGEQGLELAIGGQFEAYGIIEHQMLLHYGLQPEDYLIDVGCGSGRLAIPLSRTHRGAYLGTDIVPELLEHARGKVARHDWRFEAVSRLEIPEADGRADMVCLFSVLTHLLHEQSYLYLRDARRVLKPGGRIVFSFLEFAIDFHWEIFGQTVRDEETARKHPLNVFTERNAIERWASHLNLEVVEFRDGGDTFVPLPEPVVLDSGMRLEGFGNLGQSICVLKRPR